MREHDEIIFITLFCIICLLLHHYFAHGVFFQIEDIDNHETIIMFLLGLLVGYVFARVCDEYDYRNEKSNTDEKL